MDLQLTYREFHSHSFSHSPSPHTFFFPDPERSQTRSCPAEHILNFSPPCTWNCTIRPQAHPTRRAAAIHWQTAPVAGPLTRFSALRHRRNHGCRRTPLFSILNEHLSNAGVDSSTWYDAGIVAGRKRHSPSLDGGNFELRGEIMHPSLPRWSSVKEGGMHLLFCCGLR